MTVKDHKKINELMRKTTAICEELMTIQSGICAIQNGCEVSSEEYMKLFDAYLMCVNMELSREAVFEKLANIVMEED